MKQGAHLTKPGWSKPHTHSNPTNLALFRHKITLYRFNQGGLILLQGGGLKWEQGAEPPSLPSLSPLVSPLVRLGSLGSAVSFPSWLLCWVYVLPLTHFYRFDTRIRALPGDNTFSNSAHDVFCPKSISPCKILCRLGSKSC